MAVTRYSPSLEWAAENYPTIRGTIKKATEGGMTITRHFVKLTKRGAVYQHLFVVKNEDGSQQVWTNQRLSGFIWVYSQGKKPSAEAKMCAAISRNSLETILNKQKDNQ